MQFRAVLPQQANVIVNPSVRAARYFVLFKDDLSGYRVVFFIRHKDDTLECFQEFCKLAKNKFGNSVKVLHTDNGREYCNDKYREFLSQNGIELETTAPYTPEQNGRTERDMRTIVESARSMLYAKDVPLYLWAEAVNTAVYLLNRTSTSQTPNSTPFEMWTGKHAALDLIKTFGCDAFMHVTKELRNKLAPKSKKLVFVGYDANSSNYRLFDVETKKIRISRNVTFNEEVVECQERENIPLGFPNMDINDCTGEQLDDNPEVEENADTNKNSVHYQNKGEDVNTNGRSERYMLRTRD